MTRRITLLGATGSIGVSAADVIRKGGERFEVHAVTANANAAKLAATARELKARRAVVADEAHLKALRDDLFGSGIAGFRLSGFTAGLIALVLQNGAYIAEIYRAGIQSVSRRQMEAGLAIGLTPNAAFRIVILPQALRKVIPPLSNQGIVIIKDTALVLDAAFALYPQGASYYRP